MPYTNCDRDHTVPYSVAGAIRPCNTAAASRHDHHLKDYGWTDERLRSGIYEWTSLFGHIYTTLQPLP